MTRAAICLQCIGSLVPLSHSGEAALRQALSAFTDPEADGGEPRLFGAGREW